MQRKRQRQRIFLSPQEVSVSVPLFAFPLSVIDGKVSSVIDVKVSSVIMSPSLKRGKRDMCGGVSYPCSSDQHASSSSFLPSSHQITQEIPKVQSPSLPERGVKRRAERQENRHEVHKRTGKKNDKKEPKKTTESEAMSPVKAPVLPSSAPAPLTSVFPDFGGTLGRQEIASRPLPFFPRPLSGVQSSFRSPVVPPMEYPPPFLVQAGMRLLASHLKAGIGPMPAENGRHPTTGPFETTASSVPTTRTGRTDRVPSSASRTDHVPSSTRQRRTGELECASRPLESTRAYLDARYNVVMAKEERRALKKAKTMFFQRPSMDTKQLRMRWGKEAQIGFLAAVVCSVLTTVSKGNGFRCLRWDALPRLLELQPDDGNIFIRGGFSSFP
uniref:Uncharacterized protein n=1 Tax=Palpitomonas bilix TaxID=652834 RepID=A0A7S3G8K4_9EUKA|mmetsp:Transcript_30535/g.79200  ORF Transcript_30535/g.79200 Transcript_30535/m.79200 type:complete len:385 (+) Transcript_30535:65-1219(+)